MSGTTLLMIYFQLKNSHLSLMTVDIDDSSYYIYFLILRCLSLQNVLCTAEVCVSAQAVPCSFPLSMINEHGS